MPSRGPSDDRTPGPCAKPRLVSTLSAVIGLQPLFRLLPSKPLVSHAAAGCSRRRPGCRWLRRLAAGVQAAPAGRGACPHHDVLSSWLAYVGVADRCPAVALHRGVNLPLWHGLGTAMFALRWLCAAVVLWRLGGERRRLKPMERRSSTDAERLGPAHSRPGGQPPSRPARCCTFPAWGFSSRRGGGPAARGHAAAGTATSAWAPTACSRAQVAVPPAAGAGGHGRALSPAGAAAGRWPAAGLPGPCGWRPPAFGAPGGNARAVGPAPTTSAHTSTAFPPAQPTVSASCACSPTSARGALPRVARGRGLRTVARQFLPRAASPIAFGRQGAQRAASSRCSEYDHLMLQRVRPDEARQALSAKRRPVSMPFAAGSGQVCFFRPGHARGDEAASS